MKKGERLFSVSTGRIDMVNKFGEDLTRKIICEQEGYQGVHFTEDGYHIIWLFNTLDNAIKAKDMITNNNFYVGENICELVIEDDDTVGFVGVAAGKDKGKGYVVADGSN